MPSSSDPRLLAVPASVAAIGALAWAGSQGGVIVGSVPLFAACVGLALVVQWVAFVPAWLGRTERFFDLVGSLTYLLVTAIALALRPSPDVRAGLLAALVAVWAARLGTFLVRRIHAAGKDGRFDELKTSFSGFLMAWSLQGVWISFTVGAALAAITSGRSVPLGGWGWLGLAVWLAGFGIEVVADRQKRDFRADPANEGRFISTGLWAWSRHPNYFGEIVLWVGIAIIAAPALQGWQVATLVSPLFVTLLLTKGSGIPPLEERADARWGGEPGYERYKAETPVLVPRPPVSVS
jgi:steroid 5-alpha reductase family enzyme